MQMHLTFPLQHQGGFQTTHSRKHSAWTNTTGEKSYTSKATSGVWSQKTESFSPCYLLWGGAARKEAEVSSLCSCFVAVSVPSWPDTCAARSGALCSLRIAVDLFPSVYGRCRAVPPHPLPSHRGASSSAEQPAHRLCNSSC